MRDNKENFPDLRDADIEKLDNLDKLYSEYLDTKNAEIMKKIDNLCERYGAYCEMDLDNANSYKIYKYYIYLKTKVIEVMREDIRLGCIR